MKVPQISKNTRKKALVATGVTAVVGLAVGGVVSATAITTAADMPTTADGKTSLVEKIASRFNLNKDDVQKVFDENRAQHEADRQRMIEDRLTQAVTDGKITDTQKTAILSKYKELTTYRDSIKDKTPEEQRDLMKTKLDELKQWANDNGLSQYVMMWQGRHGHRGAAGVGTHGGDAAPPMDAR